MCNIRTPPVYFLPGASSLCIDVFGITSTYEIDGDKGFGVQTDSYPTTSTISFQIL